jgi:hypothetical protein
MKASEMQVRNGCVLAQVKISYTSHYSAYPRCSVGHIAHIHFANISVRLSSCIEAIKVLRFGLLVQSRVSTSPLKMDEILTG